jgi:hypothetical protein
MMKRVHLQMGVLGLVADGVFHLNQVPCSDDCRCKDDFRVAPCPSGCGGRGVSGLKGVDAG